MYLVQLYEYIILLIATIWTLQLSKRYQGKTFELAKCNSNTQETGVFILVIFLVLLIGLRPMGNGMSWMWADSMNYYGGYLKLEGIPFEFEFTMNEVLWTNLFNFVAANRLGISFLFLICDAIYFGCTYFACRKWFPHDTTTAFLVFLGAFSTYSYSYNGVRAGVAGAVFLLAIAYYDRKPLSLFFVFCSFGFHHSMQMPIAAYILTLFYKNPKWYFYGWAFCVLMAVAHVGIFQSLFAGMTDESGAGYLKIDRNNEDAYLTGFRLDFLLYSSMPVLIGYKIVIKEKLQVSKQYLAMLHIYLCTNGIWMLCMYASFTNRIAYLSWSMYPFVLIYPFLKEDLRGVIMLKTNNQYTMMSKVMKYHLYFTLFMELVFYKFIK